ncbi:MAG: Fic family protein [Deltaproteobacteria bacterium]|nr:Fic family protein [Deltaproteobacteria bacterium]
MTRKESVELAKAMWDRTVYFGMKMENRNVTFPDTQSILQGINTPNATESDVRSILNMRDAWKLLLEKINKKITLRYICGINRVVAFNESIAWGVLRNGGVRISGTVYRPAIPDRENVQRELDTLFAVEESDTQKALRLFLWVARSQLFFDGNKRTAMMLANKHLLQNGRGMFFLEGEARRHFVPILIDFYESNDYSPALDFLYLNGIVGKTDKLPIPDTKPKP